MELLSLLATAKTVLDAYKTVSSFFIDETANIIQEIGVNELKSAITTLRDSKFSKDKKREVASAITQMRLAIENSDILLKCKISAVIALCYSDRPML